MVLWACGSNQLTNPKNRGKLSGMSKVADMLSIPEMVARSYKHCHVQGLYSIPLHGKSGQGFTPNQLHDTLKGKWLKATLTRRVACCGKGVNLFAGELYFVVDFFPEFDDGAFLGYNVMKLIAPDGRIFHCAIGHNNLCLPEVVYWNLVSPEEVST